MQPTNPKSQPLVLPNENNPTADISHSQFLSTRDKARGRYLLVFVLGAVLVSQWPNSFEVKIDVYKAFEVGHGNGAINKFASITKLDGAAWS